MKFLAETLDFSLFTLDIHGGITDAAIVNFLEDAIQKADHERGVALANFRSTLPDFWCPSVGFFSPFCETHDNSKSFTVPFFFACVPGTTGLF